MRTRPSTQPGYVPPISFAEVCATSRIASPASEDVDAEFGPIGSIEVDGPAPTDPLEAFCDAWGAAGISPAVQPFPSR